MHDSTGQLRGSCSRGCAVSRRRQGAGFTLVEILIVVVILGILATIVIPQFSNASESARENTLKDELRYLRTQIIVFKAQHKDVPPGAGSANFVAQMTGHTDENANVGAQSAVYKYGPYLSKMPANPMNALDTIEIVVTTPLTADGSHGWVYNPNTLEIIADVAGSDSNGTPYASY